MKLFMPTILLLVIYFHCNTMAQPLNTTTIMAPIIPTPKTTIFELTAKRIHYLWTKWQSNNEENTFIGRCLGAARKLKLIMPLIVFKLGVILTVLVFLTIFSMKSLGLLFMLLMMNASGAVAKLALLLKGGNNGNGGQKPQNVHFHIHQTKDGHYQVEPNSLATWSGYERSDFDTNQLYFDEPNNYEQLQRYKLLNNFYNIENR